MANLNVTDAADASKYLKASGAGTDGDPHIVEHLDTNSAAILAAVAAIQTAAEILDNVVAGTEAQVDVVAALPAGTNLLGKMGIDQTTPGTTNRVYVNGGISIAQTPTITAGAYSAKDAVGGLLTFANAARVSGGKSVLNSVVIIDYDDEEAGLELWLFDQTFSATADNAAWDPSDADLANCVGVVPISAADYYSAADNGVATVPGVGLEFKLAGTSLFGQLKCTGTPTYTATSDLKVVLAIEYLD